ncbi:unnamed protein product [Gadus morhua 'NCC']
MMSGFSVNDHLEGILSDFEALKRSFDIDDEDDIPSFSSGCPSAPPMPPPSSSHLLLSHNRTQEGRGATQPPASSGLNPHSPFLSQRGGLKSRSVSSSLSFSHGNKPAFRKNGGGGVARAASFQNRFHPNGYYSSLSGPGSDNDSLHSSSSSLEGPPASAAKYGGGEYQHLMVQGGAPGGALGGAPGSDGHQKSSSHGGVFLSEDALRGAGAQGGLQSSGAGAPELRGGAPELRGGAPELRGGAPELRGGVDGRERGGVERTPSPPGLPHLPPSSPRGSLPAPGASCSPPPPAQTPLLPGSQAVQGGGPGAARRLGEEPQGRAPNSVGSVLRRIASFSHGPPPDGSGGLAGGSPKPRRAPGGTRDGAHGGTMDGAHGGTRDGAPGGARDGAPGGARDAAPGGARDGARDGAPGGTRDGAPGGTRDGALSPAPLRRERNLEGKHGNTFTQYHRRTLTPPRGRRMNTDMVER